MNMLLNGQNVMLKYLMLNFYKSCTPKSKKNKVHIAGFGACLQIFVCLVI